METFCVKLKIQVKLLQGALGAYYSKAKFTYI